MDEKSDMNAFQEKSKNTGGIQSGVINEKRS